MSAALRAAASGPQAAKSAGQAAKQAKKKAAKKKAAEKKHPKQAKKNAAKRAKKAKKPGKHAAAKTRPPRTPAVAVRRLVKKAPPAPPAPPGPWVTGNTAGQGLRWTHGGTVSAAVGKVFFTSGGADYVCSGTLVGSGHAEAVLTAAHCVSGGPGADGRQRWVSNWVFVPGYRNGLMPYGEYTARRFLAAKGWTGPQGGTEQYDVAFVQVSAGTLHGKSGAAVPPRGLPARFASRQDAAVPARAYVFGYPSEPPFTGLYANYCAGAVIPAGGSVRTTCGMTAGDSGGPWLAGFSPRPAAGRSSRSAPTRSPTTCGCSTARCSARRPAPSTSARSAQLADLAGQREVVAGQPAGRVGDQAQRHHVPARRMSG